MVKLLSLLLLVQGAVFAKDIKLCKETIANASKFVSENDLTVDDFSTSKFEDFNLTAKEYNALTITEQKEIFLKVRPLEIVAEQYFNDVSYFIQYLKENADVAAKNPGAQAVFDSIRSKLFNYCYKN